MPMPVMAQHTAWHSIKQPGVHAVGILTLQVNSYALHSFGPEVEQLSGSARTAAIYMASAVTGTLASFIMTPSPSVGASGATVDSV
jgi:rhomboid protease GluP